MVPPTSRYITLGETLLVAATFAGALTFTTLLTINNLPDRIKSLLGFASALFLTTITGTFPVFLILQRYGDEEAPKGRYYGMVVVGFAALTSAMFAAFILLLVVLECYTSRGAFILGMTVVSINLILTVGLSLWNLYTVYEARIRPWIRQ